MSETERTVRHDAAMASVILLLGCLLLGIGILLLERWKVSAAHHQGLMFGDIIGFVAAGTGQLIVSWWLLSLVLAFAAAAFQKSGRTAQARVAGRFSPLFMRRLALAVLGLNLLGAPLAQASTPVVEAAWSASGRSAGISAAWSPISQQAEGTAGAGVLSLAGKTVDESAASADLLQPQWQPRAPVVEPGLVGTKVRRAAQQADTPVSKEVVVLRGDTLWSIAAQDLGPLASDVDVARHWPKWYAANKDVIGADPALIVPGQILQAPPKN
ncbi:LysM peptidoglycan-binding domain-containing protein [Arthrobacter cupressi]|uniref:Uncharacterized protein n=1 Tax=Arthrobacter cupressi TaxID=1045773 RepID=A0A1G8P2B4_9MICC|nr:hypothetical protein [Arthrobacter cupressi]NYD76701.1 hypothetical protein [Arthrobacter cupressi]SDI86562.1 hypothetical protein SAMN05216555_10534 [Arthrobacter cupressi]